MFRRTNSFKRPFTRARFRSRPRTKMATRPRQNASDFFVALTSDHPDGSAALQISMLHIASMALSFNSNNTSEILKHTLRNITIGGIVFDWGVEFPSIAGDAAEGDEALLENMASWYNVGLCYDRMAFEFGAGTFVPSAIGIWQPFFSDFPTNTAGSGITVEETSEARPTRVLWNKTLVKNFAMAKVLNPESGELYVPPYQRLASNQGTVNRRLRLRLDEDHGLFFYIATLNEGGFAVDPLALFRTVWFKGTLYYTVR